MRSPAPAQTGAPINSLFIQDRGQRPTRRVRSARPKGAAGADRGLWGHGRSRTHPAGGGGGVKLCNGERGVLKRRRAVQVDKGNATRVSPARARRCPVHRCVLSSRKASARPGGGRAPGPKAGRALAVAFGATAGPVPIRRGVAEASVCAMGRGQAKHRCAMFGRIRETHVVSPARARRCPVYRCVLSHQRPAPAGGGAGAGRGLRGHGRSRTCCSEVAEVSASAMGEGVGSEAPLRQVRADQGITCVPPTRPRPGPRSTVRSCNSAASARSKGGAGARDVNLGATAGPEQSGGKWQRGLGSAAPPRFVQAGSGITCVPPPRRRPGPRSTVRSCSSGASARPGPGGRWPCACEAHDRSRTHPAGSGRGDGLCHGREAGY
jgi:hypothetical protein